MSNLRPYIENPQAELTDFSGLCNGWLDAQVCNYAFKARAPLRLRSGARPRRCASIDDVQAIAKDLGMDGGLVERPADHQCFLDLLGGRGVIVVIHDRATGRYGVQLR